MEQTSLITSVPGVTAAITFLVVISLHLSKVRFFRSLGPALIAIIFGMILSNFKITPFSSPVYSYVSGEIIMLGIAVMLLNVDLKGLFKLSKQPLLAMFLAVVSVSVVVVAFSFIFVPIIPDGWKLAGMLVGTYTGGSSNLNAIAIGLNASPDLIAAANAADYAVYPPYIILVMYLASNLRHFKWFAKVWPYKLEEEELLLGKEDDAFLKPKKWSIHDIAWILAIGFAVVAISDFLSTFFPASFASSMGIVILTTISITLAQFKQIKNLKGTMDIGLYLSLFFLARIGLTINVIEFLESALLVALYCGIVMFVTLLLHAFLCRLFKIKYQYVLVAVQSAIGSASSSTVLAAQAGWESLISVAVVLGVLGNTIGNYVGIGIAYLIKGMFSI